jgi:uncharacterized membrane protein YidH (DUF202 family)
MQVISEADNRRVIGLGILGRVVALTLWVLSLSLIILTIAFSETSDFLPLADFVVPSIFTGTIGLVILFRSSNHRMGWLLVAIGALGALMGFSAEYAEFAFNADTSSALPLRWPAAWITHWSWFLFLGMVFMILPQVFPTGKPIPYRWTTAFRVTLAYIVLFSIVLAFGRTQIVLSDITLQNPYGFIPIEQLVDATVPEFVVTTLLLGFVGFSWASLAIRYRRSPGIERQQIRWVAFALGILAGTFALASILSIVLEGDCCGTDAFGPVFDILGTLAFLGVPAAIGISVLRYRLYDIDRIIRRTLAYTLLTGVLAITYLVGVLLLQRILPAQSPLAIVLSTLVIAALFTPLRRRIQSMIDKRFYRSRYDPQEALAAFNADLRKQFDSDQIYESMLDLVDETVKPTHASLWIRHP